MFGLHKRNSVEFSRIKTNPTNNRYAIYLLHSCNELIDIFGITSHACCDIKCLPHLKVKMLPNIIHLHRLQFGKLHLFKIAIWICSSNLAHVSNGFKFSGCLLLLMIVFACKVSFIFYLYVIYSSFEG